MHKYLLFLLILVVSSATAQQLQLPSDVNAHLYQESVEYLYVNKLAQGYQDGTFKPDSEINRAEFTQIITDLAITDGPFDCEEFSDVEVEDWFFTPVCKAFAMNLIQGYPDNTFRPAQSISVAEASKIIARYINPDLAAGLPWYKPSLDYIRQQGAQPQTALDVTKPITRGEMAYMIHRLREPQPIINPQPDTIPILVYHHVRPQQGWSKSTWSWKLTVTPNTFDRHLEHLSKQGYTTISLDHLVRILNGATPPPKPVVITFDDNNLNQYINAYPALQKFGHMAVFYLITSRLDSDNYVNADRAKEMYAAGMDIQSHTHTHANLTNVSDERIAVEMAESKRILEELLGNTVNHVAYPLTAHNQRVRDQVKLSGYDTGTIMDPRRATFESDRFKLPRIMMTDDTVLDRYLP